MSTVKNSAPDAIMQSFGSLPSVRIGLGTETRHRSVRALNRILARSMALAREAAEHGDDGTNDLLVGGVIRTNEMQAWFVGEHLAQNPAGATKDASA